MVVMNQGQEVPEKRYAGNKYTNCYCSKRKQVLVGTEIYKYLNAFAAVAGPTLALLVLFSGVDIQYKLLFVLVFVLPVITIPILNYRDAKKTMLKTGHSEECSSKIARMVTFRASLWGDRLKIMKSKDDGKRIWW